MSSHWVSVPIKESTYVRVCVCVDVCALSSLWLRGYVY